MSTTKKEKWRSRDPVQHIEVNFFRKEREFLHWKFKIKDLRARNRSFGVNYGIIGDVEFNKDIDSEKFRRQFLTIDLEKWNIKGKNNPDNRLILRCFDDVEKDSDKGKKVGGTFRGGLELSMLNSLNLSIAAKRPLASFVMFLPNIQTMTDLFQKRLKWFNIYKRYVFPLYPIEDEPIRYFKVIGEFGLGDDYKVIEVGREGRVATIDHKPINFGGKYIVDIHAEDLQYHKNFRQILILACCMVNYVEDVHKLIKPILKRKDNEKTGFTFQAVPRDLEMLKNPRFLR